MATVRIRVPDELKARMEEHDEVDWSVALRRHIESELEALESRNLAHAVATSERPSEAIDDEAVEDRNTAMTIRKFRDDRYSDR